MSLKDIRSLLGAFVHAKAGRVIAKKDETTGRSALGSWLARWALLLFTVAIGGVFALLQPEFNTVENAIVILRQSVITGLLALGLTVVVISGEFDMSFAATATVAGVAGIMLMNTGLHFLWALVLVYVCGILIGLLNSFVVLQLRVPAFIGTLGVGGLLTGVARLMTGGTTFFPSIMPPEALFIGRGFVLSIVPAQIILFVGAIILGAFLLEKYYIGRHMHATGGNKIAAMHVGINIKFIKCLAFIVGAIFAVTGGYVTSFMLGCASPESCGGYLLPAISATYMGGVFLKGGLPNVWGTVIASILTAMLANGFVMLGFSQSVKEISQGIILIVAVSLVTLSKKGEVITLGF